MSIATLSDLFLVAAGYHKPDCLQHKVSGQYVPISTAEVTDQVRRVARALEKLGIERGDRVALMADNGPHWPVIDFATLCRGAATVPIYPTLLPEQAAYIVQDSGAKVAFVHTREQLNGLRAHASELGEIKLVLIDGEAGGEPAVLHFGELLEMGADVDPEAFEAVARQTQADDLASLVYTSGTTGKPKGVMLTHGNFVSNIVTSMGLVSFRADMQALSFLPLAHVFERMIDYCYFYKGVSIAYAESVQTVPQNILEVKPHVFVSVPRVYEKFLARVQDTIAGAPAVRQKLFHWALETGRQSLPYRLKGEHPPGLLGLKLALANALVFRKIHTRLGGRFEYAVSGGAPLAPDIAEFFWSVGIEIYEGYGLTETAPVISVNAPGRVKLGTVGKPIPGIEVKIAEDGEILSRGPHIMKGYFNRPDATAEVIDEEGWFHTGDIGELDAEGFLKITDRKKEIIVNAYGKNVAPAPIENALKASRYIAQAMVIGDRRKYLSALVVPDFEALATWAPQHGVAATGPEELSRDPKVRELVAQEVAEVNRNLANYEQIVRWELVPREFTIETGELTPTQKIKRRVIHDNYSGVIEQLYSNQGASGT
ncbi:MAG TPA: long-chain fatty acid--CoA ligase [Thermoanaerobaculia bacterium]|nr:long-chain fatty acid--CoA ligase [Thermoanaerobaculia bacterium]